MHAALRDGSLPPLAVERVWVTRDGRARLLDFTAPGMAASKELVHAPTVAGTQAFLAALAFRALTGAAERTPDVARPPALPLAAVTFLDALNDHAFASTDAVVTESRRGLTGADRLSRPRRAASLLLCGAAPMMFALSVAIPMAVVRYQAAPELDELVGELRYLANLPHSADNQAATERDAVEIYIAGHFGPMLSDPTFWTSPFNAGTVGRLRPLAEQVMADHPAVSADDLGRATALLGSFVTSQQRAARSRKEMLWSARMPVMALGMGVLLAALFGTVAAAVFRGGLLLRLFTVAVVTDDGRQASRVRALGRAVIGWAPATACHGPRVRGWTAIPRISRWPGSRPPCPCWWPTSRPRC